jgi:hypothetical protein
MICITGEEKQTRAERTPELTVGKLDEECSMPISD